MQKKSKTIKTGNNTPQGAGNVNQNSANMSQGVVAQSQPNTPQGLKNITETEKALYDKAYSYFEYHAGQRMTMIQFFLVVLGACIAFYAELLESKPCVSLSISLFLIAVSLIFYFIDVRNKFDVKQSQCVLREIEKKLEVNESKPIALGVFSNEDNWLDEPKKYFNEHKIKWIFKLSTLIAIFYFGCVILGVGGIVVSSLSIAGII